jgi:creatinine amidohydrolase
MDKAVGVVPKLPEHIDVKWLFHELTPYGVTGDPTKASAEKGVKMIEVLTELLISFINQMDENNWNYG